MFTPNSIVLLGKEILRDKTITCRVVSGWTWNATLGMLMFLHLTPNLYAMVVTWTYTQLSGATNRALNLRYWMGPDAFIKMSRYVIFCCLECEFLLYGSHAVPQWELCAPPQVYCLYPLFASWSIFLKKRKVEF